MKQILAVLFIVLYFGPLSVQAQDPGRKYPYRLVSYTQNFPVGNYWK